MKYQSFTLRIVYIYNLFLIKKNFKQNFKKGSEFFCLTVFADQTSVDIKYICSFFYVDSSMLDSATDLIHIFDNILRGLKNKSHSYKIRV